MRMIIIPPHITVDAEIKRVANTLRFKARYTRKVQTNERLEARAAANGPRPSHIVKRQDLPEVKLAVSIPVELLKHLAMDPSETGGSTQEVGILSKADTAITVTVH